MPGWLWGDFNQRMEAGLAGQDIRGTMALLSPAQKVLMGPAPHRPPPPTNLQEKPGCLISQMEKWRLGLVKCQLGSGGARIQVVSGLALSPGVFLASRASPEKREVCSNLSP